MKNVIHVNFKSPKKKVKYSNGFWYIFKTIAVTGVLILAGVAYALMCVSVIASIYAK